MISRLTFVIALLLAGTLAAAAQFGPSQFPIKDNDGDPVANHSVDPSAEKELLRLPGSVVVGNAKGDVTLVQFYDLNCPFCREAARDVDALLREDPKLKLIFVPYPVLSLASVEGGKVEVAVATLLNPERFLEFHQKIYAGRGLIDGARALAVAAEFGLDQKKIIAIANEDDTTDKLKTHARLANAMGLVATPSYVIRGVAILGHPGLAPLQRVVAAARKCGKVVC
jgi:protein-disulfide isomerase